MQVQAFAAQQAGRHHAQLHRAEQQQRPGTGIQLQVGAGEGSRVDEQRRSGAPVAGGGQWLAAQAQQQPEHQGAGGDADGGEAHRVHVGVLEGEAAEQGVAGERQHGQGC
ncbi:hypothetical protein D9M71_527360 [compost metagenome]